MLAGDNSSTLCSPTAKYLLDDLIDRLKVSTSVFKFA